MGILLAYYYVMTSKRMQEVFSVNKNHIIIVNKYILRTHSSIETIVVKVCSCV